MAENFSFSITENPSLQSFFLLNSREAFNIFFHHHPQPMWMYNKDTLQFTEVNEAAISFYGFSRNEFLKSRITELLIEREASDFVDQHIHAIGNTTYLKNFWVHKKKNNETFYAEVTSTPVILDGSIHIIDIITDRTAQIIAEQDLTERKAHEQMLEKLNNSLEKRAKELASSNEELEKFAYVASHDLQEPLRMVSSFLQLLRKRYNDKLDQKALEYIAYAVDGADRMKRLILDLLEYSRVNSSQSENEDVNVNQIIEELLVTYKPRLKETGGTIAIEKLPTIKGSKILILQLFQNILSNAIKYRSKKPPLIEISAKENSTSYTFAIKDNGIGIDPKFFAKIFVIFQRLHNREQYSGTGIGLAICKKIIDKHGGKIWLTSTPGEGSTFYFTLPKP